MISKDKIREQIAFGISPPDVAAYHNISLKQLLTDYKDVVFTAGVDLDVEIAKKFYGIAMGIDDDGNAQACINWLKSRCQWDKLADKRQLPDEENTIRKVIIETLAANTDVDKVNGDNNDDID